MIDAVAVWNHTYGPIPGTYIESNAFTFPSAPGYIGPVPVFHSDHSTQPGNPPQDQFLPALAADHFWTGYGTGSVGLAWVDSIEDSTHQNQPSGVYGVTASQFTVANPGFLSGPSLGRIWPVPPAPATLLGVPINNGFDWDVLGRHNSISANGGLWWLDFSGDWTSGHSVMHVSSIAPP